MENNSGDINDKNPTTLWISYDEQACHQTYKQGAFFHSSVARLFLPAKELRRQSSPGRDNLNLQGYGSAICPHRFFLSRATTLRERLYAWMLEEHPRNAPCLCLELRAEGTSHKSSSETDTSTYSRISYRERCFHLRAVIREVWCSLRRASCRRLCTVLLRARRALV